MMPFQHTEGRIAFIKAELAVTDAQSPQWNAFAEMRSATIRNHARGDGRHGDSAAGKAAGPRPTDRRHGGDDDCPAGGHEGDRRRGEGSLCRLTDAQKETANDLLGGPMMAMGGKM